MPVAPPLNPDVVAAQPWDRLDGETAEAFIAFSVYRDMALRPRSIRKAYKTYNPNATNSGSWFNWSTKYGWKERCAAFDAWLARERVAAQQEITKSEAYRIAENQRQFRDTEAYLADLAAERAAEILSLRVVQDSWTEQRDGKTIIHKASILGASHLLAAAALMRAASDIGRKGHGLRTDEDSDSITIQQFQRLFFKHTGEIAPNLPPGALPAPVDNPAVKPSIHLPTQGDALPGEPGANAHASGDGENGNGVALPDAPRVPGEIVKYRPQRDRP